MRAKIDLATEWRSMQRRLVDHLREPRSSDRAEATTRLPAQVYTDPKRFDAERERVFGAEPLLVGFSGDLPRTGDRILFDAAGPPVVVVRGEDGQARAFLNLCPHRGSRLVEDCTATRRLVCPFHAWSFDLAGRLTGTPDAGAFSDLDRDSIALVSLPTAEWGGMIFVRTSPGPAIDVEAHLGDFAPLLLALELETLEPVSSDILELESNWKIALDTFCETYHVPALHRESLATNLIPYITLFDHYGRHHRYSGPGLDFHELVDRPEDEWPTDGYQAVHFLFPNTTIAYTHALDGKTPVVSMFRMFPGARVGESLTIGTTYRRRDAPSASDEEIREMHAIVREIVRSEDYRIAKSSYESLVHAPEGFEVILGRSEALLQRYHTDLAEVVGIPISQKLESA